MKSETLQLNISDKRSGLGLSSLKYCIINSLAYHLQYGSLKYFLILWFTCSEMCVKYCVLASQVSSAGLLSITCHAGVGFRYSLRGKLVEQCEYCWLNRLEAPRWLVLVLSRNIRAHV